MSFIYWSWKALSISQSSISLNTVALGLGRVPEDLNQPTLVHIMGAWLCSRPFSLQTWTNFCSYSKAVANAISILVIYMSKIAACLLQRLNPTKRQKTYVSVATLSSVIFCIISVALVSARSREHGLRSPKKNDFTSTVRQTSAVTIINLIKGI